MNTPKTEPRPEVCNCPICDSTKTGMYYALYFCQGCGFEAGIWNENGKLNL